MLPEEKIKPQLLIADTEPAQAAENIVNANKYGAKPEGIATMSEQFKPRAEDTLPESAPPVTASIVKRDSQLASLVKPEVGIMSKVENYFDIASSHLDGVRVNRRMSDLAYEKAARGGKLSPDEEFEYLKLNRESQKISKLNEDRGYQPIGLHLPVTVLGVTSDFARGLADNWKVIAAGMGVGAGAGLLGGPAAPATVPAGAITGFGAGVLAAGAYDTMKQSTGSVYADLDFARNDDGTPLNLPENTKRHIAFGAGTAMAVVDLVVDKKVLETVPWAKRLMDSKAIAKLISGPAWKEALAGIGEATAFGSSGEVTQEMMQLVAEKVGRTYDGTETSFLNGLKSAAEDLKDPATRDRLIQAGVIGGVAGGGFSAAGQAAPKVVQGAKNVAGKVLGKIGDKFMSPPPPPGATPQVDPDQRIGEIATQLGVEDAPVQMGGELAPGPQLVSDIVPTTPNIRDPLHGTRPLELQIILAEMSGRTKDMQLKQLSADEFNDFRRRSVKQYQNGKLEFVYADPDAVQNFIDKNPKAAEKIRNIIDPSGLSAADLNSPIRLETHQVLQVVDDFPEFSGVIKESPESMSGTQFLAALEDAKKKREAVLGKLATVDEATRDAVIAEAVETMPPDLRDTFDEDAYVLQPTFTRAVGESIPLKERQRFDTAQLDSRMQVSDAIKDAANLEMNQVVDVMTEIANEADLETALSEAMNDPNIQVVENFVNSTLGGLPSADPKLVAALEADRKKGWPVLSIDVDTLSERQKNKYAGDLVLKKRKAFRKGGAHVEDVAQLLGVPNTDTLLDILQSSPTLEQVERDTMEKRAAINRTRVADNVDLNETAIAKAYNNHIKNRKEELKYLLEKHWAQVKSGIKRIALTDRLNGMRFKAESAVGSTRINALNVNQFKVGERRSHRKALNHILKNEVEQASQNAEAAILAAELSRATHIAIGGVNRGLRRLKKFQKGEYAAMLKEAGPTYEAAAKQILDLFRFGPAKGVDVNAYSKYVKSMLKKGQGDFTIPQQVFESVDFRENYRDLTVDQFRFLADTLGEILHTARLKNKLVNDYVNGIDNETLEIRADKIEEYLKQHPGFNPDKAIKKQGNFTAMEKIGMFIGGTNLTMTNLKYILSRLDQDKDSGLMTTLIYNRLKGIGEFKGAWGESAATTMLANVTDKREAAIEKYGKKEWYQNGIIRLEIEEFAGIPALNNGKMNKIDLIAMAAHWGARENRERLGNFGISESVLATVFEKHLEARDFDFLQESVWDTYAALKPKMETLNEQTLGVDLKFTEPAPFHIHGKTYRGGHMTLSYIENGRAVDSAAQLQSDIDAAVGDKNAKFIPSNADRGQTKRSHEMARVGSKMYLDLSPETLNRGIEQTVWDLAMRVPVMDSMKMLADPKIAQSIRSVLGVDGYQLIVNIIKQQTHTVNVDADSVYREQNRHIKKIVSFLDERYSASKLIYSIQTLAMQTLSLPALGMKVGPKGAYYFAKSAYLMARHAGDIREFFNHAAEINPDIANYQQGVNDFAISRFTQTLPKKRMTGWQPYHVMQTALENTTQFAFDRLIGGVDVVNKTIATNAMFMQYMNGHAPDQDVEAFNKLSDPEKLARARSYASNVVQGVFFTGGPLDKAAVQNIGLTQMFTKFWNDLRNVYNIYMQQGRKAKASAQEVLDGYRDGGIRGAVDPSKDFAGQMAWFFLMTTMSQLMSGVIRGRNPLADEDEGEDFSEMSPMEIAGKFAMFYITSPVRLPKQIGESTIGIRDIIYATEGFSRDGYKRVSTPMISMMSDIATGSDALSTYLENDRDYEALSKKQKKAVVDNLSYLQKGIPANAINKVVKKMDDEGLEWSDLFTWLLPDKKEVAVKAIDNYLENNADAEFEAVKKLREERKKKKREPGAFTDALIDIRKDLKPAATTDLENHEYQAIKYWESHGKWDASPSTSSAFGVYQFTKGTWRQVMDQAPELDLTENGRVSKDTSQQEKAMKWLTQDNIKKLRRSGFTPTLENVYIAHFAGISATLKVLDAKDTAKLQGIIGKEAMKANGLKSTMTIQNFKQWVKKKMDTGRERYEASEEFQIDNEA